MEERWWLRVGVEEEEEEEEGVEGRWLGWCCRICRWVEEMMCIDEPLKGKTIVNSIHHTTLKYYVT